ncbi:hypothetical protein FOD75_11195 (plasmid) [Limosilactobacillus reuteri]|uniref:Uncharacterized protein n=1 Tax=Limosilactobacillus reuteri TaxID=1598 RepID=A0A517D8H2_LIMRT|nr:hypothetical protein FOD75_11195 [Limosilactobacillus reuteri]
MLSVYPLVQRAFWLVVHEIVQNSYAQTKDPLTKKIADNLKDWEYIQQEFKLKSKWPLVGSQSLGPLYNY